MLKYLTKFQLWLAVSVILLILFATVAFNIILDMSIDTMTKAVDKNFTYKISVGDIYFIFPNRIILKNVAVSEKTLSRIPPRSFFIPTIRVEFSLLKFLLKQEFSVSKIGISKPVMKWVYFCDFLRKNYWEIVGIIKKLPRDDIRIDIKDMVFRLTPRQYGADHIAMDIDFTLKGDSILISGALSTGKYPAPDNKRNKEQQKKLRYKFKGNLKKGGFFIDSLFLRRDDLYSKLWGDIKGSLLHLKGFAFLKTHLNEQKPKKISLNIVERIKLFLWALKGGSPPDDELEEKDVYLTDIDCVVNLAFPKLEFQRFGTTFNNAPLSSKGNIILSEPIKFDLDTTFYPTASASDELQFGNLKRADMGIRGNIQNDTFHVDGNLDLLFTDIKGRPSIEQVVVGVEGLIFNFRGYPNLKTSMLNGYVSWRLNNDEHRMDLSNLKASVDVGKGAVKYVKIQSSFYEGILNGSMQVDTSYLPFKMSSEVFVDYADANQLDKLLVYFSKMKGSLFSRISFHNYPKFEINGNIDVQNGNLKDFEFFKWLAESFAMHSLVDIDFDKATTKFSINEERYGIYDIDLESRDLKLKGDFFINRNSLVSSKLSLFFSRELIGQSPDFKSILKFFDDDISYLDFDFQLSGDQDAMNFQWLQNESKKKIQDGTPNFIERIIDRRINAGLETDPERTKDYLDDLDSLYEEQ